MKKDLEQVLKNLLSDALEEDTKKRIYKLSDSQLIYALNQLGEFFLPKEVRSSTDESRSFSKPIEVEFVKSKTKPNEGNPSISKD